jgi:hypothetical protein
LENCRLDSISSSASRPRLEQENIMTKYFLAVYDALFEKPTHDLVGAVVIAMIVSLALAGLYKLARRKASETLVLSSIFLFAACLVSMVLTLGFTIQTTEPVKKPAPTPVARSEVPVAPRPKGPGHLDMNAANSLLLAADLDKDGTLSPEEAAQFVRSVDTDDKGSVDIRDLSMAFWERVGSKRDLLGNQRPRPASTK